MKTVVLCGSRRFKPGMREFGKKLKELGVIVFEPYLRSGQDEWAKLSDEYKKFVALGLIRDHFYKIQMADVFLFLTKTATQGIAQLWKLVMPWRQENQSMH